MDVRELTGIVQGLINKVQKRDYALRDGFLFTAGMILLALIPAIKLPHKR